MARARNIKPGFFANEDLAECSPWARLCFAGLWTLADREGRLEDRPKRIKGELFRYDSVEVEPLLDELERFGFVERYQIDGLRFIQVSKFAEHQTPHYSEKPSVIKPPPLQEKAGIKEQVSESDPGKDPPPRGGRNPLIPDSLIPDSGKKTPRGRADPPPGRPEGVCEQVWADWLTLRKAKRAPVTATVLGGASAEAVKAGMPLEAFLRLWCARGTQGLQADWLRPHERKAGAAETPFQRSRRENVAEFTGGLVARRPGSATQGDDDAGHGAVALG